MSQADFQNWISQEEAFILKSEKSKSVGDMISGVTHELNNPLAVILGRIQNIERKAKTNPQLEAISGDLKSLMNAALKMDKVIKSLRLFAKCDSDNNKSHCFIKDILENTQILVNNKLTKTPYELEIQTPENYESLKLYCNPGQIQTALFHLISNAMNNMGEAKKESGKIKLNLTDSAESLTIQLQDEGSGFTPHAKENFGIPFWKSAEQLEVHLGLYVANLKVQENGGSLSLKDSGPHGSTLLLSFPKT